MRLLGWPGGLRRATGGWGGGFKIGTVLALSESSTPHPLQAWGGGFNTLRAVRRAMKGTLLTLVSLVLVNLGHLGHIVNTS